MEDEIHASQSIIVAYGFSKDEHGTIKDEIRKVLKRAGILGIGRIRWVEDSYETTFEIESGREFHSQKQRTLQFFGECFNGLDDQIRLLVDAELLPWITTTVAINSVII